MKAAGLLYDLLPLAPNTKSQPSCLLKALKTMRESRDLELNALPPVSNQDAMDKLDFTIRLLISQLRSLKASSGSKVRFSGLFQRKIRH